MSTTVDRGNTFRDLVLSLLRASGKKALSEKREAFKKVDIACEWYDAIDGHRILLVEAKDFNGTLPKRECVEFVAEYGTLVRNDHADGAWLVSRNPVSADARALVAANRGLRCLTFEEFQRQLLQLDEYLRDKIEECERAQIEEFFVPPKTVQGEGVTDYVIRWLHTPHAEPLVVTGAYGIGKSTFARRLTWLLGRDAIKSPETRIPILVPLGEIFDEQSLDGLIGKVLASRYRASGYHFDLFEELNASGRFVVIFDGFDEMKHGMTAPRFQRNINELLRLDRGDARLLFLGRKTAFHSDDEYKLIMNAQHRTSSGDFVPALGRRAMREVEMRGFTVEEAKFFMRNFFPIRARQEIKSRGTPLNEGRINDRVLELTGEKLDHLLDRPVHAQMLCEIAAQADKPIGELSLHGLYNRFVTHLIDREVNKRGRFSDFGVTERMKFNASLAWWLWERGGALGITLSHIPDELCTAAASSVRHEFDNESLRRELVAGCLIDKGGDKIYFEHRSIQEFLVAEYIMDVAQSPSETKNGLQPAHMILEYSNSEINQYMLARLSDQGWPSMVVQRLMKSLWEVGNTGISVAGIRFFARAATEAVRATPKSKDVSPWSPPNPAEGAWQALIAHFTRGFEEFRFDQAHFHWYTEMLRQSAVAPFGSSSTQAVQCAIAFYWSVALMRDPPSNHFYLELLLTEAICHRNVLNAIASAKREQERTVHVHAEDAVLFHLIRPCLAVETTKGRLMVEINLKMLAERAAGAIGIDLKRSDISLYGNVRRTPLEPLLERMTRSKTTDEVSLAGDFFHERELRLRLQ
jgi:hypothetical protein